MWWLLLLLRLLDLPPNSWVTSLCSVLSVLCPLLSVPLRFCLLLVVWAPLRWLLDFPLGTLPGLLKLGTRSKTPFAPCPSYLFKDAGSLCGSTLPGTDRVERAWRAGQWAKAVKDRRIGSPNRTPAIDLRPRYYAVLFAEGLENPTIFQSAASYWKCIKSLEGSSSISQSFPSELEARIYLQAAGAVDFSIAP